MTIPNRTVSITGVFAESAITTIPQTPVPGTSYRDTSMTDTEVESGWPFKTIVDSGKFNQAMFQYSTICSQIEKYGFLPWSSLTNYVAGSLCLGSDGVIYQAKQNTGPSSTAKDPTTDTNNTYWEDFVGNTYVTKAGTNDISANNTFSGSNTFSGRTNLSNATYLTKQDSDKEGGEIHFDRANNDPLTQDLSIDRYNGTIRFIGNGTPFYVDMVNKAAVCLSSDMNNSVVNTVNKSKSSNGYFKLGNGLIVQWGEANSGNSVNFPTPFTGNWGISAIGYTSDTNTAEYSLTARSNTSFTIKLSRSWNYKWLAIGY